MKLVIATVTAPNELVDSEVSAFGIKLHDTTIERMKMLAQLVSDNDLTSVNYSEMLGLWSNVDIDEIEDGLCAEAIYERLQDNSCRMDLHQVKVSSVAVTFSAIPKHEGAAYTVQSCRIPLCELGSSEPLIIGD